MATIKFSLDLSSDEKLKCDTCKELVSGVLVHFCEFDVSGDGTLDFTEIVCQKCKGAQDAHRKRGE